MIAVPLLRRRLYKKCRGLLRVVLCCAVLMSVALSLAGVVPCAALFGFTMLKLVTWNLSSYQTVNWNGDSPLMRGVSADGAFGSARGVVTATTAFVWLLFTFLFSQSGIKSHVFAELRREARKAGKRGPSLAEVKYSSQDARCLLADRIVGNLLEQRYFERFRSIG
jgi:hypothetical protein